MKTNFLFAAILGVSVLASCSKVRNCECKTTWVEYTEFGAADREETTSFPVKGTKKDAKTECDIIATNQDNIEGHYTLCSVKD